MKNIHIKRFSILFILSISLLLLSTNTSATKWVYPFVVWDGYVYVVTDEYVDEIDKEIGGVSVYSDMEELPGNFSNAYKKGTAYYSIRGIKPDVSIAVQEENGKYRKADREEKYHLAQMDEENKDNKESFNLGIGFLGFVFHFVMMYCIYRIEMRLRK
ncbi:hypothetical protein LCL95_01420 [Bacillus timonensis]|nr:hypothetical protein [Bacillus timonensis]